MNGAILDIGETVERDAGGGQKPGIERVQVILRNPMSIPQTGQHRVDKLADGRWRPEAQVSLAVAVLEKVVGTFKSVNRVAEYRRNLPSGTLEHRSAFDVERIEARPMVAIQDHGATRLRHYADQVADGFNDELAHVTPKASKSAISKSSI